MKQCVGTEVIATLIERFDCVVMLDDGATDSAMLRRDAMRLRMVLPVVLVSPPAATWTDEALPAAIEPFPMPAPLDAEGVESLVTYLAQRGVARPLLWVGEASAANALFAAWPNALRIMHLGRTAPDETDASLRQAAKVDLLIVDDEAAYALARVEYGQAVPIVVIGEALDAEPTLARPVALSDAGLGVALDPEILHALVHRLPWWDLHVAGDSDRSGPAWQLLSSHPSVRDLGPVDAASLTSAATAIVLPCASDADSAVGVRLDALIASGLPVIASPALGASAGVTLASSLDAFADNLRRAWAFANLAGPAQDCAWLGAVANAITTRLQAMLSAEVHGRLNILLLYDDRSTFTSTVLEHLESFAAFSRHSFHYMPATGTPIPSSASFDIDLSMFDAIICHYSVRLSLPDYLQARIAAKLERFHGLKLLFIQDEYDTTETARRWMERIGFDVVYTCVPPSGREYVYPKHRLPRIEFLQTLTGYVPMDTGIDSYALPIEARATRIAYRGRMLPYHYGTLGWEKYRIGVDVKRLAQERGVCIDIEVDDSKRIYGADWYRFIGSARATLGTESGSNVFDFDGTVRSRIEATLAADPQTSFETLQRDLLAPLEAQVRMNQISPKIFEAARLRTALILFEGEYSGVVKPYEHYLPLRHDYGNLDEVLAALEDIPRLREMTDRTYRDLIASGRYAYQTFVRGIDADIESRLVRGPRHRIFAAPAMVCDELGTVSRFEPDQVAAWCLFDEVLCRATTREQASELFHPYVPPPPPPPPPPVDRSLKARVRPMVRGIAGRLVRQRAFVAVVRPAWRLLPARLRRVLGPKILG